MNIKYIGMALRPRDCALLRATENAPLKSYSAEPWRKIAFR
jgi:hypothetical protein